MPSASSASSRVEVNDWLSSFLLVASAIGGPALSFETNSSTTMSSSLCGTTRLTRPISWARCASRMSANSTSSFAFCIPTILGRMNDPPKSMLSPRRAKISLNRLRSEASTKSQASAMLRPAPAATPSTRAIVGFGRVCNVWQARPTDRIPSSG